MRNLTVPSLFAAVIAVSIFACGDSEDSSSSSSTDTNNNTTYLSDTFTCDSYEYAPCGGDLVGTWDYVDACIVQVSRAPIDADSACDTSIVALTVTSQSLDLSFAADGTYSKQLTYAGTSALNVSEGCLTTMEPTASILIGISGFAAVCADAGASLANDARLSNVVCSLNTTSEDCECNGDLGESIDESGTYTIDGNTVNMIPLNKNTGEIAPYCVDDDMLLIEAIENINGHFALSKG